MIRLIDVSLTGVPTCCTKFYNFRAATLLAINIILIYIRFGLPIINSLVIGEKLSYTKKLKIFLSV